MFSNIGGVTITMGFPLLLCKSAFSGHSFASKGPFLHDERRVWLPAVFPRTTVHEDLDKKGRRLFRKRSGEQRVGTAKAVLLKRLGLFSHKL